MAAKLGRHRDVRAVAALVAGGTAALLAAACCLGPLVLVMLGLGGAWVSNLAGMEPYRPYFAAAAVLALWFAHRAIFRSTTACEPSQACAAPRVKVGYKVMFWIVTVMVLFALVFPYLAPLFY